MWNNESIFEQKNAIKISVFVTHACKHFFFIENHLRDIDAR